MSLPPTLASFKRNQHVQHMCCIVWCDCRSPGSRDTCCNSRFITSTQFASAVLLTSLVYSCYLLPSTDIWKSFGRRNSLMSWDSCCVSALGNSDSCQSSTDATSLLAQTRPAVLVTRLSRDSSSTVLLSDVEDVSALTERESFMESQRTRELTSLSSAVLFAPSLRSVSDVCATTCACWTLTGLTRTTSTSTSRSFLSTHNTLLSETILVSTGSVLLPWSTVSCAEWPPLDASPVVSPSVDTELTRPLVVLGRLPGRDVTPLSFADTVKRCLGSFVSPVLCRVGGQFLHSLLVSC